MREVVIIALSGALGSVSRYLVSGWAYRIFGEQFAYGTIAVNIIGCFALGVAMEMSIVTDLLPRTLRLAVTIGFLGAFTTFSTFGYETHQYMENGAWWLALLNVAGNVVLGIIAVWAGLVLGRSVFGGV